MVVLCSGQLALPGTITILTCHGPKPRAFRAAQLQPMLFGSFSLSVHRFPQFLDHSDVEAAQLGSHVQQACRHADVA